MVPSFPRPGQQRPLVLGAARAGLGWGATVAALGSGATVSGFLRSGAIKGLACTKALIDRSMSCSEATLPESPEPQSRCCESCVCLPG